MAKQAEVIILGNRYKLTTDKEEEGWLEKLAADFNGRVDKIAGGNRRFNPLNASILIGLQLEEEMYNLKQEARLAYERIKQQHDDILKQQQSSYEQRLLQEKSQCEKLLSEQKAEYEAKLLKERKTYEARLSAQNSQHSTAMRELRELHAQALSKQQRDYAAEIANLKSSHEAALTELQAAKERQAAGFRSELANKASQQEAALKSLQEKYEKLQKDYDELMELLDDA